MHFTMTSSIYSQLSKETFPDSTLWCWRMWSCWCLRAEHSPNEGATDRTELKRRRVLGNSAVLGRIGVPEEEKTKGPGRKQHPGELGGVDDNPVMPGCSSESHRRMRSSGRQSRASPVPADMVPALPAPAEAKGQNCHVRPSASTSLKKKCIYYENQPAEDVIEAMDVKARGTTALGVSAWSLLVPLWNQLGRAAVPQPCPGSAGLIDQPRATEIGATETPRTLFSRP
ncbi:uncharacterized protein LOC143695006 [Agelaius phoeniceus]|uniref:uncharacterized protein LOC143695006 n=1 Tax=Agelaius phoeniceus TaxID=39638 RepID=UPI004054B736